jgi:hypothetical protein
MRIFRPKTVAEGLSRFCADCANLGDCVDTDCPLRYFSPHLEVKRALRKLRVRVYRQQTRRFEMLPVNNLEAKKRQVSMRVSFIIASYRPQSAEECIKSIKESVGEEHQFVVIDTRPENLNIFQAYDAGAQEAHYSILCFIHEDARLLSSSYWLREVGKYFDDPKVGILGVAGSKDLTGTGRWWEGMGQPDGNRLSGMAIHTKDGQTWPNAYGPFGQVLVLDGLCLILKKSLYEELQGYHYAGMPPYVGYDFYDIDPCFRAHLAGYKNYTIPLLIEHQSMGEPKESWYTNKELFVSKYMAHLPARI